MEGILPLFKPAGLTSHDCVFRLRKILKTKKSDIQAHLIQMSPECFLFVSERPQRLLNT